MKVFTPYFVSSEALSTTQPTLQIFFENLEGWLRSKVPFVHLELLRYRSDRSPSLSVGTDELGRRSQLHSLSHCWLTPTRLQICAGKNTTTFPMKKEKLPAGQTRRHRAFRSAERMTFTESCCQTIRLRG